MIVDDSANRVKRNNNIRSEFVDDCGVWDSSTGNTVDIHFMITDEKNCRLRTIFLKDGIFCNEKRSKYGSKTTQLWNPIHPQPTKKNLVKIQRYYTKQKGNHTFKKRVTTFEKNYHLNLKQRQTLHLLNIVANKKKSADLMETHRTKKSIILEQIL